MAGDVDNERWGLASTDEMCIDFVSYWPKIPDESVRLDVDLMQITSYDNGDCSGAPVDHAAFPSHQPGYGGGGCLQGDGNPSTLYVCGRDGSPTVVSLWAGTVDTSDTCSDFTDAVNTTITSSSQCVTWGLGTSASSHQFECVPQTGSTYVEATSGAIPGPDQLGRIFGSPATGSPTPAPTPTPTAAPFAMPSSTSPSEASTATPLTSAPTVFAPPPPSAAPTGLPTSAPTAPSATVHTISWGNVRVELASITVDVGDTVRWVVDQEGGHNVVSGPSHGSPDGTFSSPWLGDLNDEWSHTFDEVGVFPYYCAPHSWMVATIAVVNAGGSVHPTSAPTPIDVTGTSTGASSTAGTTLAPASSAPTLAPTTSAPTALPTTPGPTATPTTSAPTTAAPTVAPSTVAPTASPTPIPNLTPADKAMYVFAGYDLASLDVAAQVSFKAAVRAKVVVDAGGTVQGDDISAVELSSGSIVATVWFDGSVTMDDVRGLSGTSATLNVDGTAYHGAVTVEPVPSTAESDNDSADPAVVAGVAVGVIAMLALIVLVTFQLKGQQRCKVVPNSGRRGSIASLERTVIGRSISRRLSARRSSTKSMYEDDPSPEQGSLIDNEAAATPPGLRV